MITKNVKLYLTGGFPVRVPVSQFDTAWEFVFTIIKDGLTWEIPSGASAVLNGLKPDGNVFAFSGTISGNAVTVDCDVQMTAVAGDTICELSIFTTEGSEEPQRANVVGTANFVLAVEAAPNSTGATPSASDVDAYGAIISGELDTYFEQHPDMIEGKGLSEPIRLAILDCFQHVAWVDEHGSTYYDTLYDLLMTRNVLSITAVFEQGSAVIYDTDSLDTLKQYLTVTANYDDGTSGVVTTYSLSGSLDVGTNTITVSYSGKTTTFSVTVSERWTYSISDLTLLTGVLGNSENANCKMHLDTAAQRRSFVVSKGQTPVAISNGSSIVSQTSDYFPIKIPYGAQKVTISVTPSTQYVQALLRDLSDGVYTTMTTTGGTTGYQAGSNWRSFDPVTGDSYVFISTKYNSAGSSYPTNPTGLDIVFE